MAQIMVRPCQMQDVPAVVDILTVKRAAYARREPTLWKPAPDARAATISFLESVLREGDQLVLVAEAGATDTISDVSIAGFLVAAPLETPPVYDAGPTALIEDFYVSDPSRWPEIGAALLAEARILLKQRGMAQILATSGYADHAKMVFLKSAGLSLASACFTAPV